jgi:hypothetical protein
MLSMLNVAAKREITICLKEHDLKMDDYIRKKVPLGLQFSNSGCIVLILMYSFEIACTKLPFPQS